MRLHIAFSHTFNINRQIIFTDTPVTWAKLITEMFSDLSELQEFMYSESGGNNETKANYRPSDW